MAAENAKGAPSPAGNRLERPPETHAARRHFPDVAEMPQSSDCDILFNDTG